MASRIPKPKPSSSSRTKPHPRVSLDDLHASLSQLGAPQITKEELGRLYQGALGDALVFVAEHVKGRKGCAVARELIHKWVSYLMCLHFSAMELMVCRYLDGQDQRGRR
jgi:hypothetical protein